MVILVAVTISFTESRTITGLVTDPQGKPLSGVSVIVKGASAGTVTDIKGKYTISVEQQDKALVFSLAGYVAAEEKIESRSTINVKLNFEVYDALDEMEIAGYGAKKEKVSMSAPSASIAYDRASFQRYNNNFNTEGYASIN